MSGGVVRKISFDPQTYWMQRSDGESGLAAVGHRSFGVEHNRYIYQRRTEVLQEYLEKTNCDPRNLRVLDIGCGSGYYTEFWREMGVKDYMGIDVSRSVVARLEERYPDMKFVCGDISKEQVVDVIAQRFNFITLFDVLYHIVSDQAARAALCNVGRMLEVGGVCVVFDQLSKRSFSITEHVRYRAEKLFLYMADSAGLAIRERRRLFLLLVPPLTGFLPMAMLTAGIYKIAGMGMRRWPALDKALSKALYRCDQLLFQKGFDWRNNEAIFLERTMETPSCRKSVV